jgi:molybdate transport system ATP-binding protein
MRIEIDIELSLGSFRLRCDCRVEAGVLGVFGPSGAGKTTLLHALAGLRKPSRGRIALDGEVLFDTAARACVPAHRRRIGVVFQDHRLFPHLSVRGNLKFAQKLACAEAPPIEFDSIVRTLELDALMDRKVSTLSGGECQRVALGRALLAAPRLLLLDEPVSAVDAGRRSHLLPMLRRVARRLDLPVIIVSHELHQILYLTDHLLLMDSGRCVAQGCFQALLHDPAALRLLHPGGIVNLLRLRVSKHQPADGITLCSLGDACASPMGAEPRLLIRGPLSKYAAGAELTATLRPEDVILSLAPAEYISAQNQIVGCVKSLVRHENRTLCCVDVGTDLFVDVTHYSAAGLELTPGKRIWCLFKAHAVKYLFGGGDGGAPDGSDPGVAPGSRPTQVRAEKKAV